jgi:hypothetical protein
MKTRVVVILAVLCALAAAPLRAMERLEPPEGCYFGISLGAGDTLARLASRLGVTPAVAAQFFHFPLSSALRGELIAFLDQVRPTRGIALITLEPFQGLSAVTEADCLDLARLCATHEAQGIGGIMIRFAHEMNGNWYPWCQQPGLYREKFGLLARTVHTHTTRTAMLWAPHNGVGYPFSTQGAFQAAPGSPDFAALDTNGDGWLTAADDMYEPYYPGDDVVDWVGMIIYHWGAVFPWLENEMPLPNSFAATLRGTGLLPPIPDFYARYCADRTHQKPLAIPETAALYNPQRSPGPGEFQIKQAWWRQIFNAFDDDSNSVNIAVDLPKLKCLNWFDHYKPEAEAQHEWIDWRVSADPVIREAFVKHLRRPLQNRPYFLTAPNFACAARADCIVAEDLPHLLPLTGSVQLSLTTKAQAACDLVVDLLDDQFQWQGGTRTAVLAGTQSVALHFTLNRPLMDGLTYRWSIFLTPTGSNYLGALAWHQGPGPVARALSPSIQIAGYPPTIAPGSSFTVKVQYTSVAVDAVAQVNIFDADHRWRGGGTQSVRRGDGLLDVTVTPQPALTNGVYMLECFLSDSPTHQQAVLARSENRQVRVATHSTEDFIQALPRSAFLPTGEVFRFLVTYSAVTNCDLHVDLFDANTNFITGTLQPVGQSSGFQEMTLSAPNAAPGTYFVNSFLTAPGQLWTKALAWGVAQPVTVLSKSYFDWVEWRWGVVLGSDSVLPDQDADGDGASNEAERIADTAPLNAAEVLRLNATMENGRLVLNWRSAVDRQYQLFESDELSPALWVPFGDVLNGSGGSLQASLHPSPADSKKYYRLAVWQGGER